LQIASQKKEETVNETIRRKKSVKFFNNLKTSKRKANALLKENPIQFFENYRTEVKDFELKRGNKNI
jgi:hypothetical protein